MRCVRLRPRALCLHASFLGAAKADSGTPPRTALEPCARLPCTVHRHTVRDTVPRLCLNTVKCDAHTSLSLPNSRKYKRVAETILCRQ
eukprot:614766-Prymnesium_polylepis.2